MSPFFNLPTYSRFESVHSLHNIGLVDLDFVSQCGRRRKRTFAPALYPTSQYDYLNWPLQEFCLVLVRSSPLCIYVQNDPCSSALVQSQT